MSSSMNTANTDTTDLLLGRISWKEVTQTVKHDYANAQRQHLRKLHTAFIKDPKIQKELNSNHFIRQLSSLSRTMDKYKDEDAQGDAIDIVLSSNVYSGVDARSNDPDLDPKYGYTDLLVKELLRWFKEEFFKWVNKPQCTGCGNIDQNKIQGLRPSPPSLPIHFEGRASVIENYRCANCGLTYQFPRYNNPRQLLKTRSGRCGEWANCFVLILKSLEIPVRYLWNLEDHVWCEYYSIEMKRWIHLDCCENAYDNPLLYNHGWGKKMSYVFAIAEDYIVDVSDKYIDKTGENVLPRNKIDETSLKRILFCISAKSIENIEDEDRFLQVFSDYLHDFNHMHGIKANESPSKTIQSGDMLPRQSGAGVWTKERGEDGSKS